MLIRRRSLAALLGAAALPTITPAIAPAWAQQDSAEASPESERAIGKPDAPVVAIEYFSFTCPHCARFARDTFPQIKKELIEPGKLRWVFGDFPLDQIALTAAMVAHALPPARYEPFAMALFATQDRWAFARGVNSTEELAKLAALAGMSRQTFDATINDTKLRDWILNQQDQAQKKYGVDSTPTFILNGPKAKNLKQPGEMPYDTFLKLYQQAAG